MQEKNKKMLKGKIIRRKDLTKDLWKIWIKPEEAISFEAGQYCTIGVNGLERPYSIVSAPGEELIELFIELIPSPQGQLTPVMYELFEGSEVTIRKKTKGLFKLQEKFTNHIMVSTVTGVAPFVSMLRDGKILKNSNYKTWILEGASYIDEFGYDQEIQKFSDSNENIKFTPTCSRPSEIRNKNWNGSNGRVNEILKSVINNIPNINKENTIIYACGHPKMVSDVAKNYSKKFNFIEERFWKA